MSAPTAVRPNVVIGFPADTYIDQCPESVQLELKQFYSLLQGWLSVDHKPDGTHKNVRADSVASTAGFTEFGRDDVLGVAVDIYWTPSNYSASGAMTWAPTTAQQASLQACRIGNLMYLTGEVDSTNVGGVADVSLYVKIPFVIQNDGVASDFVVAAPASGTLVYSDAGGAVSSGWCRAQAGSKYIELRKFVGNWTITAANDTTVLFSIVCPIKQNPL